MRRLQTRILRPPIRASAEWVNEAPPKATALIVAEYSVDRQLASRRVGLAWLSGSRNDASYLRTAASSFPDTAGMINGADVRNEPDGSVSICSPGRCKARWTIRSVPLEILTCWAGFENGMCAPGQPESVSRQPQEPVPTISKGAPQQPAKKASPVLSPKPESPVPARVITSARGSAGTTAPSLLPVFAPMAALILNLKEGIRGNCAAPDGKFVTDGHILLKRSACNESFLSKLKPTKTNNYGPENPLPEETAKKLFDGAAREAKHDASAYGFILGASAGGQYEADDPFVCIVGPSERITIVSGHKLRLIQTVTGANTIKTSAETKSGRVVLFKDDEAVAVLMAFKDQQMEDLFRKMLEHEHVRPRIDSIPSPAARRVAV